MEIRQQKESMNTRDFIFGFLLLGSCVEPFDAGTVNYEDMLVVEGILTNETKQHQVTITRTSHLGKPVFNPEKNAIVTLKAHDGFSTTLTETSPGIYKTPSIAGVVGKAYTLSITTSNGNNYASEEVVMKNSPPVDKIYARYVSEGQSPGEGIQIYLDTSDPKNSTHYYRWEYEETYEIRTPFPSKFVWLGGNTIFIRTIEVDNCWATDSSKSIMIQSTTGFESDKVTGFPVRFIPAVSPELVIKYSILVKQYALNEKSYIFWNQLKEVNDMQGSLFDKQVGKVTGNISSTTDKSEIVLGYFDASAISTKRAFFSPREFPDYTPPLYLQSCVETAPLTVPIGKLGATMEQAKNTLIIADAGGVGPDVVYLSPIACCDCTSKGTNLKPSYWE
jgi:Domain of unknown function (DUF4249)